MALCRCSEQALQLLCAALGEGMSASICGCWPVSRIGDIAARRDKWQSGLQHPAVGVPGQFRL